MPLLIFFGVLILFVGFHNGFGIMEWIGFLLFLFMVCVITCPLLWSVFVKKLTKKFQEKNRTGN